ncbi:Tol-Pal system-associated acyl-CoA thioesterase [hydrothermal vent metagenome]|uniref:Tol-Pal system-associated acyl-CoA thioesterase n=1 Tax=hydrothermal vent metagenome TaxID=652676 RepID=A0A3B0RVM6_9ZZZZ
MSQLPATGQMQANEHILPVRIYYEDTDFSGVVYHAAFLKFMERGRTESMRATGTTHQDLLLGDVPLAFAVRRMELSFFAPARIDDVLLVRTRLTEAKGARMRAEQAVFCQDQELVRAKVELACIDLEGRPRRIPKPALQKMLAAIFITST